MPFRGNGSTPPQNPKALFDTLFPTFRQPVPVVSSRSPSQRNRVDPGDRAGFAEPDPGRAVASVKPEGFWTSHPSLPEGADWWPALQRRPEGLRLPGPPQRPPKRPLWLGRKAGGAGARRSLSSAAFPDLQGNWIRRGRDKKPLRDSLPSPLVADHRVVDLDRLRKDDRAGLSWKRRANVTEVHPTQCFPVSPIETR